jgi:hypothetical protein
MRRAHFLRAKQSCPSFVAQLSKVVADLPEPVAEVGPDILDKHHGRLGFSDDAADVRPEVAGIFPAQLLTRA